MAIPAPVESERQSFRERFSYVLQSVVPGLLGWLKRIADAPPGWQVLFTEAETEGMIDNLVGQILEIPGIKNSPIEIFQVLNGARQLTEAVVKKLRENGINRDRIVIHDIGASSYDAQGVRRENVTVTWLQEEGEPSEEPVGIELRPNCVVLVVDELLDHGNTMIAVLEKLRQQLDISDEQVVHAVVLLEKKGAKQSNFENDNYLIGGRMGHEWMAGVGANGEQPGELGESDGRDLKHVIRRLEYGWVIRVDKVLRKHLHGQVVLKWLIKILEKEDSADAT